MMINLITLSEKGPKPSRTAEPLLGAHPTLDDDEGFVKFCSHSEDSLEGYRLHALTLE